MRQRKKRANKSDSLTLQEVAKRAGVSSMTISRVLKNDPKVKDITRKK